MSIDTSRVRKQLDAFNFRELFIEELGWSNPLDKKKTEIEVNSATFERVQIAQLSGVVVFEVTPQNGAIPDAKTRRAIHTEIAKSYHENIIIFVDGARTQSLWYWVKRESGKSYPREHLYMRGQAADLLLGKINAMVFDISDFDEKGNVPIVEVANRIKKALDVERVTKKFYKEYEAQHIAFVQMIEGIADERKRNWYASILFNRLMFIYFLQKKGFINNDFDYLTTKLNESRADKGANLYYQDFLKTLFFVGFAKPEVERHDDEKRLLGDVPYLNGGLFLQHRIELDYLNIRICDEAFENLYKLFGSYSWNLDDTPSGKPDEMNPDVLGYIFEKYINQKAFGAYYTRPEITQYLCEQTIYKLILERVNSLAAPKSKPETGNLFPQERTSFFNERTFDSMSDLLMNLDAFLCDKLFTEWLPDLKLLDPACGSGAFLVAAMKTLINIYSAIIGKIEFLGDEKLKNKINQIRKEHHGSADYYIKKQIITNNLFGVDIMEEATEIARLRLFLALVASAKTRDQLEPLPNIDFNILAGNSLIGILKVNAESFDQLAKGTQASLLTGLSASNYEKILEDKNKSIEMYKQHANLQGNAQGIDQDIRLLQLREHIDKIRKDSYEKLNQLLLGDFEDLGIKYEQATWDEKKNKEGKPEKRKLTLKDVEDLRPFHWGFEFDEVINKNGGFDAIITNPPWEIFKPQAKEFFQEHSDLVTKNKMTIKEFEKEQAKLLNNEEVREAWLEYQSRYPYVSLFYRNATQYKNQIALVNGKKQGTDINLYKLFTEQCFNLLRKNGECGIVIPSGIYTDLGTKQLREMLFNESKITGLFCFENRKEIFEGVHRSFKFVVLTFQTNSKTKSFPSAFMRHHVAELERFPKEGSLQISVDLIRRLSPDSLSVMEFKNDVDIRIAEKMLRFPLLGERIEDVWNLFLTSEFHMTNDSHLFKTSSGNGKLPLYEGKMIHQFSHTLSEPRYWIDEKEARKSLLGKNEIDNGQRLDYQNYRLGFRDVARNTDNRTMIAGIIPPNVFAGNTLIVSQKFSNLRNMLFVLTMLDSFSYDYMIRQKVTAHCNMFYVYQVPVPRLTEKDKEFAPIVERAARLICTTPEFDELARDVGLGSHKEGATNETERARLRAELDGLIAHIYGLTEEEFTYILTTFPLVSEPVKLAAQNAYRDVERGLIK
jgi:hypothetical protein